MHNSAMYVDEDSGPMTPAPPPEVLVAGHYVSGAKYRVLRPNGTRDWQISFTRSGSGCYQVGNELLVCNPGDIVLLLPGTIHDYATHGKAGKWDFYWAHFQPRPNWNDWLALPERAVGLKMQSIDDTQIVEQIERAFGRLLAASQGLGAWQAALSENALEEVLILVAQQAANVARTPIDARVALVMQTINDGFNKAWTVPMLAELVGLSPSRLAHLFKAQTGLALVETIITLRLRQAARLLEFSDLPISAIASEVGFESSFYFSRQFRAHYGCSPSDYRGRASE